MHHDFGEKDHSSRYLVSNTSSALDLDRIRNALRSSFNVKEFYARLFLEYWGETKQTVHSLTLNQPNWAPWISDNCLSESKLQDIVTSVGDVSNPDDENSTDAPIGIFPWNWTTGIWRYLYYTDTTPFSHAEGLKSQVYVTSSIRLTLLILCSYLSRPHSTTRNITQMHDDFGEKDHSFVQYLLSTRYGSYTQCLNEIVQRHEVLRPTFSWSTEGKLKQTIHSFVDFDITLIDFRHEINPARKARKLAIVASKGPNFKVDRLPLFTVTVINLRNSKWPESRLPWYVRLFLCLLSCSKTKSSYHGRSVSLA